MVRARRCFSNARVSRVHSSISGTTCRLFRFSPYGATHFLTAELLEISAEAHKSRTRLGRIGQKMQKIFDLEHILHIYYYVSK